MSQEREREYWTVAYLAELFPFQQPMQVRYERRASSQGGISYRSPDGASGAWDDVGVASLRRWYVKAASGFYCGQE